MGRAGQVNVKRKEEAIKSNQPSAARRHTGVLRKIKLRQNVLDGADFVRDVTNSYFRNALGFRLPRVVPRANRTLLTPHTLSQKATLPLACYGIRILAPIYSATSAHDLRRRTTMRRSF